MAELPQLFRCPTALALLIIGVALLLLNVWLYYKFVTTLAWS